MKKVMRICFVGDSFVNGTGDPECLGWTGRICVSACKAGHDITYYNLGVRRETSVDILERWHREVSCRLSSGIDGRVLFSFGANDTSLEDGKPRVAPGDSMRNARQILGEASKKYPVLMVGSPPAADAEHNDRVARLCDKLAPACKELGVPYLETLTPLLKSGVWVKEAAAGDGAHPAAAGYSELARLVQTWPSWTSWFA